GRGLYLPGNPRDWARDNVVDDRPAEVRSTLSFHPLADPQQPDLGGYGVPSPLHGRAVDCLCRGVSHGDRNHFDPPDREYVLWLARVGGENYGRELCSTIP